MHTCTTYSTWSHSTDACHLLQLSSYKHRSHRRSDSSEHHHTVGYYYTTGHYCHTDYQKEERHTDSQVWRRLKCTVQIYDEVEDSIGLKGSGADTKVYKTTWRTGNNMLP